MQYKLPILRREELCLRLKHDRLMFFHVHYRLNASLSFFYLRLDPRTSPHFETFVFYFKGSHSHEVPLSVLRKVPDTLRYGLFSRANCISEHAHHRLILERAPEREWKKKSDVRDSDTREAFP